MKKKPIENKLIVQKLTNAGLVPESRFGITIKGKGYYYHLEPDIISYKIPVDIYKKHIGVRFTTPLQLNNIVRVRKRSTRDNVRRSVGQDIGDIYEWGHLGIGSGKNYLGKGIKPLRGPSGYTWNVQDIVNPLTIGEKYIMNVKAAIALEKLYIERGYKVISDPTSKYSYKQDIRADMFFETVTLEPTGLFGPKRIINGYVTEIYVHFLYPDWKYKREARYQVTFDTGAKGIFTSDMLDRVFDTDYDVDEALYCCNEKEKGNNCNMGACDHVGVHLAFGNECSQPCPYSDKPCEVVYDFTQLCETTIQRGTGEEDDDE